MNGTSKFQWSKMSPDRSEQVVVRSDDPVEWAENIEIAKKQLPKVGFPNDTGDLATVGQEEAQLCKIHKKPFRKGKYGWFCPTKLPDDTWCKQHPPVEYGREA